MSEEENKNPKTAAILIIGNEILSGRTLDTNTSYIAEKLVAHGVETMEVRVLPDNIEKLASAINELRGEVDYIFTTGGIGPTHDDITAEGVAKAFGVELKHDDEAFSTLEEHYGTGKVTDSRAVMALVPEGASLIPNLVSGAPGFVMGNVYTMAGVPRIMQAMLDFVLDRIQGGTPLLSNAVACDLTESLVARELAVLQDIYPKVAIGSYPHYRGGSLGLSLVLRSVRRDDLEKATDSVIALIRSKGSEPKAISLRNGKEEITNFEKTYID